ncbi:MAG: Short-chain dehydrogenase/reductase SDR [uncultured Thermomicrobiales bacterium]|uniref:Short-chain dehydrogenase/reductase SDR n=1 Tax=uncultured Thermomicrobiales bacterium TaxID=1645740 RepID=A0A6J4VSJ5_9BACT|nr:MAG: Short-chain dehydrogenase/reductase SDR [uncultured Thermomicrobiales bacterium]
MATGTVIVTGASTGIGEATAAHLQSLGFSVLAGVRSEADAERVAAHGLERMSPLMLDVTDAESIAAAAQTVGQDLGAIGLAGLVNNAGIAVSAPLEFVPIEDLRMQLEVNVIGQVAVTQAFLPLLRVAQGRIVNMGSIGGRVALPLVGAYAASKFALEAITDTLRRELHHQGVEVVVIEPGGIKTPIWEKGNAVADRIASNAPPAVEPLYGKLIDAMRLATARIETDTGLPPVAVAEVVGTALTVPRPRTRYVVGRDARLRAVAARVLPDRVFDWLVYRALGL